MKNNKGFAITSIIYAMLILFLGLILLILGNLANRKAMFDKEKNEILSRFNGDDDALKKYKNGDVVYFDVDNGTECSNYTETQSNTGVNRGCMKFYAFNDDGGKTVKLILDHNTTATVEWNSNYETTGGPKELLIQLERDTKLWQGTETPANYTMDQTGQLSNRKYTIYYSGYKARLITAQEIAQITGYTSWDEKKSDSDEYEYGFYFDSKQTSASDTCNSNDISGCSYRWLYDRTSTDCTRWGCLNAAVLSVTDSGKDMVGYWTASSSAADSSKAWNVLLYGNLNSEVVNEDRYFGVRPVIEVSRSKLSNTICTSVTTATNGNVPQGNFAYGDEYTCELGDGAAKTFYVLETNGNNVSLIMNANVDSNGKAITPSNIPEDNGKVQWVTKEDYLAAGGTESDWNKTNSTFGNNNLGPITAKKTLETNTKSWVKLTNVQITLPTASQIATAVGKKFDNENVVDIGANAEWLYDYMYGRKNSINGISGYWTSTPNANNVILVWAVSRGGQVSTSTNTPSGLGIRPVITIPKSQIK